MVAVVVAVVVAFAFAVAVAAVVAISAVVRHSAAERRNLLFAQRHPKSQLKERTEYFLNVGDSPWIPFHPS